MTDAVVRVAIGALRQALGDTAQTPRFIATVPRRGYRFLAPVTVADAAAIQAVSASPPAALTPAPSSALGRTRRPFCLAPVESVEAGVPGAPAGRVGDG